MNADPDAGYDAGYDASLDAAAAPVANPYHRDGVRPLAAAPFAGRAHVLGRLYPLLTDAAGPRTAAIIGARRAGKTALLLALRNPFLPAYVALRGKPPADELDLYLKMAEAVTKMLRARGFSLARFDALEPPDEAPGAAAWWWRERFLPDALAIARTQPGSRLLILLDDAEVLLDGLGARTLPADLGASLAAMLESAPALALVAALDAERERDLSLLGPLIAPAHMLRLNALTEDETRWLLQTPVRGAYATPDSVAAAVYRATGGAPALVQAFGSFLFDRWAANPGLTVMTLDDVKAITPAVTHEAADGYRALWARLAASDRAVLVAMAQLRYADPLARTDAAAVEAWLRESDHPLEPTAVGAAMRSLEYHKAVVQAGRGAFIAAGMLFSWVLEHGRMPKPGALTSRRPAERGRPDDPARAPRDGREPVPLWAMLAISIVIGVLVAVVVLAALDVRFGVPAADQPAPAPTVTLAGPG
jgi:hypothetical protein